MWVPTMSNSPARHDGKLEGRGNRKEKKPIGRRRKRPKMVCQGGGVMVIKYTMSRGYMAGVVAVRGVKRWMVLRDME